MEIRELLFIRRFDAPVWKYVCTMLWYCTSQGIERPCQSSCANFIDVTVGSEHGRHVHPGLFQ